jgi:hypothetical protein
MFARVAFCHHLGRRLQLGQGARTTQGVPDCLALAAIGATVASSLLLISLMSAKMDKQI